MFNTSDGVSSSKKCKANGIKIHPARFPMQLPEFFIKMLTDEGDLVLDPFGGSMTAGAVAESLNRRWIGIDTVEEYLDGALYRFEE
ncbi:DNA methyltransferase [Escherichia coli]|uniref:DNA methyltransferase n=1 Tax=Escherichia coli TaxID=562 RepID=UPI003C6D6DF3